MSVLLDASHWLNFVPYNFILAVIGGVDMIKAVTRTFLHKPHISEAILILESVNNI